MAFKLCPPNAKKLSFIPIFSLLKISCHSCTNFSSIALVGAIYSTPLEMPSASGFGKACLSIFPLGVNGKLSNCTK